MLESLGLAWLPVAAAFSAVSSAVSAFVIATSLNHTVVSIPYISDCAESAPESSVFSLLMNITAVLAALTFYVRFQLLRQFLAGDVTKHVHLERTNMAALVFGQLAAVGISLVGNFQYATVPSVHIIGALLAFVIGTVYAWLQAVLSLYTVRRQQQCIVGNCAWKHGGGQLQQPLQLVGETDRGLNGCPIVVVRFTLCVIAVFSFVLYEIFMYSSFNKFTGANVLYWTSSDKGWVDHVISCVSQWTLFAAVVASILTYSLEFRVIRQASLLDFHLQLQLDHDSSHQQVPAVTAAAGGDYREMQVSRHTMASQQPITTHDAWETSGYTTKVIVSS